MGSALVAAWSSVASAEPVGPRELAPISDDGPSQVDTHPRESWAVPVVHGLGVMVGMRIGAALIWPDPFADTDGAQIRRSYHDAWTKAPVWDSSRDAFEWDGDAWHINVLGHAAFGSELYLRARTCKKNVLEALVLTAAGSTLWEYGFEANAVRPSGLDLWYTPLSGLVLGEARFWGWSAADRIRSRSWRGVVRAVLDPFGELERLAGTPC